ESSSALMSSGAEAWSVKRWIRSLRMRRSMTSSTFSGGIESLRRLMSPTVARPSRQTMTSSSAGESTVEVPRISLEPLGDRTKTSVSSASVAMGAHSARELPRPEVGGSPTCGLASGRARTQAAGQRRGRDAEAHDPERLAVEAEFAGGEHARPLDVRGQRAGVGLGDEAGRHVEAIGQLLPQGVDHAAQEAGAATIPAHAGRPVDAGAHVGQRRAEVEGARE